MQDEIKKYKQEIKKQQLAEMEKDSQVEMKAKLENEKLQMEN